MGHALSGIHLHGHSEEDVPLLEICQYLSHHLSIWLRIIINIPLILQSIKVKKDCQHIKSYFVEKDTQYITDGRLVEIWRLYTVDEVKSGLPDHDGSFCERLGLFLKTFRETTLAKQLLTSFLVHGVEETNLLFILLRLEVIHVLTCTQL